MSYVYALFAAINFMFQAIQKLKVSNKETLYFGGDKTKAQLKKNRGSDINKE